MTELENNEVGIIENIADELQSNVQNEEATIKVDKAKKKMKKWIVASIVWWIIRYGIIFSFEIESTAVGLERLLWALGLSLIVIVCSISFLIKSISALRYISKNNIAGLGCYFRGILVYLIAGICCSSVFTVRLQDLLESSDSISIYYIFKCSLDVGLLTIALDIIFVVLGIKYTINAKKVFKKYCNIEVKK